MKTPIFIIASLALGAAVGLSSTAIEFSGVREEFQLRDSTMPMSQGARVFVVGESEFDFGSMELGGTGEHEFVFENQGTEPLRLEKGKTTCKCTLSDLATSEIPPGERGVVKLEWKPVSYSLEFRQTAEIHTNDPNQPVVSLHVTGRVTQAVRSSPADLVLNSISANSQSSARFQLFAYRGDDLEITKVEFANPETVDAYHVRFEPMPPAMISQEQGATSGLLGTLEIKPGLPLGPINQRIRLETNVGGSNAVEIPIGGSVVSDISIVGGEGRFNSEQNLLSLDRVLAREGAKSNLFLVIKGPHREEIELTLGEIDPALALTAELGPRKIAGSVVTVPLTVAVPKNSPSVNRLGSKQGKMGRITIQTTHPQAKEIHLYVRFAVES